MFRYASVKAFKDCTETMDKGDFCKGLELLDDALDLANRAVEVLEDKGDKSQDDWY